MGENLPAKKDAFRSLVESPRMFDQMKAVLPKHMTPERMVKLALVAALKTPQLRECTPESIANCLMAASETGLEPGGSLGLCYIIPYGKVATFIIGYRGMIDLARRSGQILSIEAHVVYQADKFCCNFGSDPKLEHEPAWDKEQKDNEIRAVYAVAKIKGGGTQIEVMTKPAIDAIRKRSRASGSGPWVTDYGEMCRKTVVRRLFKYLPVSTSVVNEKTGMTLNDVLSREDELAPLLDAEIVNDSAQGALTAGRHPLANGAKAPAPEKVAEQEAAELHEKAERASEAIDKALEKEDILPAKFDEGLAACGFEGCPDWTRLTDEQKCKLATYFMLKY
jgi:recombination protein RecT